MLDIAAVMQKTNSAKAKLQYTQGDIFRLDLIKCPAPSGKVLPKVTVDVAGEDLRKLSDAKVLKKVLGLVESTVAML